MTLRVFIDGAAGTTGLEIRDRLADRRDIVLATLPDERRRDPTARADALAAADIAILCLPDDAARDAVAMASRGVRIIDASSAHRIDSAWTYGFAELEPGRRDEIAAAARVSNPGCYPTGFLALVRPLVRAGLLPADAPLTVNAVSGYSGGGKAMIAAFEDDAAPGTTGTAWRGYALGLEHKHAPEMRVNGGLAFAPVFAPSVARAYRGMVVEVPLNLAAMAHPPAIAAIRAALSDAYAGSALVRLVDRGPAETIAIEQAAGTDRIDLSVLASPDGSQVRLVAVLDNLGKGAAGAAVQNLNLMAGFDEMRGLRV